MPKFFHLTRKRRTKTKRRHNSSRYLSGKVRTFNIIIFSSLIILFLAYLVQINSLATKGYVISGLEKQLLTLEKENAYLQSKILSLQTTERLSEKLNDLGMVATSRVEYLEVKQPVVAFK